MGKRTDYLERLTQARGTWQPQNYAARLEIPDERIAILSDVHLPYHDETLLAHAFERIAKEKCTTIVWLGDLLDMPTFSSWGQTDHSTMFTRELSMVREVLKLASEVVPCQYWSQGNHETRWMRKLDHQVHMEQLALMAGVGDLLEDGRLIVSDNPSLDVYPGNWMLTHPAQYGAQPLVVPGRLAGRYMQNVMAAHAHHWAMGTDPTGFYTVVETGGLFQPDYHQYIQHRVTAHRAWVQGFWLLMEGTPVGFRGENK